MTSAIITIAAMIRIFRTIVDFSFVSSFGTSRKTIASRTVDSHINVWGARFSFTPSRVAVESRGLEPGGPEAFEGDAHSLAGEPPFPAQELLPCQRQRAEPRI